MLAKHLHQDKIKNSILLKYQIFIKGNSINMTDAKLISYTINDFSTEIEMESFLHLMEKHGDEFYKKLKKHGLIRWRINQIWNKAGGFALSSIFEYRDQKAFEKSIEEIKNFQKEHENYFNKVNMKRTSSRSINMLDFNY